MLRVAIVGDHGSGKTTFLGLLYAALVSSGSGREDELRFHVAYDSLDEIMALYQRILSGGFPDAATKEGLQGLGVELDATQAGPGSFFHLGARKETADASASVHFSLPGSLDEASPGLHQGSTFGTGRWRDALDADVVAILVDATMLAPKTARSTPGPMEGYDRRVESLFVAIQRWRSSGGRGVLHPVFVFTKFDSVKREALRAADLEATPPAIAKTGPRAAYSRALLEPNLPRTLALVRGNAGKKLRFAPPGYVFSRVHTEAKGSPPREQIRLRRTDVGGWEPDYSKDECLAFLGEVARIAAGTRD